MWSSSVSLKLMLLFHKELRMLLFNSDRSKPLQCRKASGKGLWKLPCFYHALRIDFFWLLDWEAVTVVTSWRVGLGRALENSHLSPKVCARTARIWKSVLLFFVSRLFLFIRLLGFISIAATAWLVFLIRLEMELRSLHCYSISICVCLCGKRD